MLSWYQHPRLFIVNYNAATSSGFAVFRCMKELHGPIKRSDLKHLGNGLSKSLSLGNNKESDFDAFLAYLVNICIGSGSKIYRFVNSQGLAINQEITGVGAIYSWSREPLNSPFYNLPGIILLGIIPPVDAEKEGLERAVSDLKVRISTLEADVRREKHEKRDLEKQVSELTLKLRECSGARGGSADEQPWKSVDTTGQCRNILCSPYTN